MDKKERVEFAQNKTSHGVKNLLTNLKRKRDLQGFRHDFGVLEDHEYNDNFDFDDVLHSTEDIIQNEIKRENLN